MDSQTRQHRCSVRNPATYQEPGRRGLDAHSMRAAGRLPYPPRAATSSHLGMPARATTSPLQASWTAAASRRPGERGNSWPAAGLAACSPSMHGEARQGRSKLPFSRPAAGAGTTTWSPQRHERWLQTHSAALCGLVRNRSRENRECCSGLPAGPTHGGRPRRQAGRGNWKACWIGLGCAARRQSVRRVVRDRPYAGLIRFHPPGFPPAPA